MSPPQSTTRRLQYSVDMKCNKCVTDIENKLLKMEGVTKVTVNLANQQVLVDTSLPCQKIAENIESAERRAVLVGVGTCSGADVQSSCGVSMVGDVKTGSAYGVIRMVDSLNSSCIFDGTIDGLQPNKNYTAKIHEYGDLSEDCKSCGPPLKVIPGVPGYAANGFITNFTAEKSGRGSFVTEVHNLPLWAIIGRSILIHDKDAGRPLSCGIIARSAGLFENVKKICACDGVTLWEERNVPIAGTARSKFRTSSNL